MIGLTQVQPKKQCIGNQTKEDVQKVTLLLTLGAQAHSCATSPGRIRSLSVEPLPRDPPSLSSPSPSLRKRPPFPPRQAGSPRSAERSPCVSRRDNSGGITAAQFPSLGALPAMTTGNGNTSACVPRIPRHSGKDGLGGNHALLYEPRSPQPRLKKTHVLTCPTPPRALFFFFLPAPYQTASP